MNTRKAYTNVIKVAMGIVFFFSAMSMACDEGPTPDNAAGLLNNYNSAEQAVVDALAGSDAQNVLSGGQP